MLARTGRSMVNRAKCHQDEPRSSEVIVYLSEILAGLRRRWWLVVLGVAATAVGSVYVMSLVPAEQVARASVLLVPPEVVVGDTGNPYLGLNGLQPAADVLARALNDGQAHVELAPPEGTSDFVVSRDTSSSGPVLVVEVTGTDAVDAVAMLDEVLAAMPPMLEQLQTDVDAPTSSFIRTTVVTRDDIAEASSKSQIRALLVAVVGGLAVTAFITYAVDGLLVRRSLERRRGARGAAAGVEAPAAPAPAAAAAPAGSPVPTPGSGPRVPVPGPFPPSVLPAPTTSAASGAPSESRTHHARPAPERPARDARPGAGRAPASADEPSRPAPPGFVGSRSKSG